MTTSLTELLDYSINNVKGINANWRDSTDTTLRVELKSAEEDLTDAIRSGDAQAISAAGARIKKAKEDLRVYIDQVVDLQLKFLNFADEYDIDVNYCINNAVERNRGYTDADAEFWQNAMTIAQSIAKQPSA